MVKFSLSPFFFYLAFSCALCVTTCLQAQALNPDEQQEIKQLLLRAKALSFNSKPTIAITEYKQVLKRFPDNSEAHSGLGWCFYQTGKINEAIAYQKKAITLDPLSAEPHFYLAAIYMSQKQYQTAHSEHQIALKLAKNRPCNCGHQQRLLENLSPTTQTSR